MVRLAHRYVDLRTERMQRNLRMRAKVNRALRRAMDDQGFVEVETPMLIASTPEGARDFVVPSRQSPGEFYALPQSPQLFKQLCMVGGIDRYYQIARCLRDEDLRADRQFEFMQLDAEASFVTQEDVLAFISVAVSAAAEAVTGEAVHRDPTAHLARGHGAVRLRQARHPVRDGADRAHRPLCRDRVQRLQGRLRQGPARPRRGRVHPLAARRPDRSRQALGGQGPGLDARARRGRARLARWPSSSPRTSSAGLIASTGAEAGDMVLLVADERPGAPRPGSAAARAGPPPGHRPGTALPVGGRLPAVRGAGDDGRPVPAHHPFTMPHPDDLESARRHRGDRPCSTSGPRPTTWCSTAGSWGRAASGSIGATCSSGSSPCSGSTPRQRAAQFGFLLDAFRYGAPPHAGFAFGIDRLVALLAGEENIREVIAFPKTQSGADPLTQAPTPIDAVQLEELGLRLLPPKKTD